MAFDFEAFKDSMVSAGKEVGDKVCEVSNVAKLRIDIRTKKDYLEKQFAALGRAFYQNHKEEDIPEKDFFPAIAEALEDINRLENDLLKAQGAVVCPDCGKRQEKTNAYCNACGVKL